MTYSLPFGLKQKPVSHYFEHGVIRFSIVQGKLLYRISKITKTENALLIKNEEVKSKEHLDKLLSIKSIDDIHALEVVN